MEASRGVVGAYSVNLHLTEPHTFCFFLELEIFFKVIFIVMPSWEREEKENQLNQLKDFLFLTVN